MWQTTSQEITMPISRTSIRFHSIFWGSYQTFRILGCLRYRDSFISLGCLLYIDSLTTIGCLGFSDSFVSIGCLKHCDSFA